MKYLKPFNETKFNENKIVTLEELGKYIEICFIDFYDDMEKYDVFTEIIGDDIHIAIDIPSIEIPKDIRIEGIISNSKEVLDFYENIEVSIKKVISRFDNIEYYIDLETSKEEKFIRVSFKK